MEEQSESQQQTPIVKMSCATVFLYKDVFVDFVLKEQKPNQLYDKKNFTFINTSF